MSADSAFGFWALWVTLFLPLDDTFGGVGFWRALTRACRKTPDYDTYDAYDTYFWLTTPLSLSRRASSRLITLECGGLAAW